MKYRPMLVTSCPLRPDSDKYAFEVKWEGFRALIEAVRSGITIWSAAGGLQHATLGQVAANG